MAMTTDITAPPVNGGLFGSQPVLVNNAQLSFTTAGLTEVTSSTVTMPMPVPPTTASGTNDYVPSYKLPQPQNETREIPVMIGNGEESLDAGQLTVTRSTDGNGIKKDTIAVEDTQTTEIIKKVLEIKQDTVDMVVTDIPGNNADSVEVQVSKDAMAGFAENNLNLGLETGKAKLKFPKETVMGVKDEGIKLTIEEVKDTKEIAKTNALLQQMAAGAQKVSAPINIESNVVLGSYKGSLSASTTEGAASTSIQNADVKEIILPIKSSDLPNEKNNLKEFINSLAILVQHSNGENRLQKGTIEYDKDGNPTGVAIWVDKFSTFTLAKTNFDGKVNTISEKQNPDKVWNIQFTKEVDSQTVTEDNIYVLDSKGSKVDVEIKCSGNNVTIKPVKNYNLG
jgi:guanyl-specific ribonuclease Sa